MRDLFLLDPDVVFLNHGSFGACPTPVFEEYQRLQREVERRPMEHLSRERGYPELVDAAKARLAAHIGSASSNLVFATNATEALNAVARSLRLDPGDEVLAPAGEYGAVDMLWRHICARANARYVRRDVDPRVPVEEALAQLWAGVTADTRAIVVSHVSSFTGVVFPVADLCARAEDAGILTIVDGAHAPGQIELELDRLGAGFYAGNCHKWICAPKGSGFLYARPEVQPLLEPFVVSWDWEEQGDFATRRRWAGTRDVAAWLAVPAAIDFQAAHGWEEERARCHDLAAEARHVLADVVDRPPLTPAPDSFAQMVAAELPPCDPKVVQRRLLLEHAIEIQAQSLDGVPSLRVSFQAYNDVTDLARLVDALRAIFA